MKKLEIGCGTAFHIKCLKEVCKEWGENYYGIDISPVAVEKARSWGIRAICSSIHDPDQSVIDARPYDMFIFLDVLEHLTNHKGIAETLRILGRPGFTIFGNVPLYNSDHLGQGGYEREMNMQVLDRFLRLCNARDYEQHVYGIDGWPYLWFEAKNG